MKTRAAARNKLAKTRDEDAKAVDIEQQKLAAETWLKEGVVINPKFKEPSPDLIELWKLFVTSANSHPNMLVHQDFLCIRDLLQFFGVYVTYESCKLLVELDTENGDASVHHLQPHVELVESSLACTMFGKVEKFQFIPRLNAVIILEYKIMEEFMSALSDMVDFIWTYPEALLYDGFAFIYEFLLKFGVSSYTITYEIYQTQCRRAQNKIPGSSLLLKLGIPESIAQPPAEKVDIESEVFPEECSNSEYPDPWKSQCGRRRSDSSLLSLDSGVETSCESLELDYSTPASDFDANEELGTSGIVFAKKSVVQLVQEDVMKPDSIYESDDDDEDDAVGKPFKCTTCKRRYISKGNCNWHIRKTHPGAPLLPGSKLVRPSVSCYCSVCGKGFTSPQYVKNHIERLHPKESTSSSRRQPSIRDASFKFFPMKKVPVINVKLKEQQQQKRQFTSFSRRIPNTSDVSKFRRDESLRRLILLSQPEIKLIAVDKF